MVRIHRAKVLSEDLPFVQDCFTPWRKKSEKSGSVFAFLAFLCTGKEMQDNEYK